MKISRGFQGLQVSAWQSATLLPISCNSVQPVPARVEEPVSPVRQSSIIGFFYYEHVFRPMGDICSLFLSDWATENSDFKKWPKAYRNLLYRMNFYIAWKSPPRFDKFVYWNILYCIDAQSDFKNKLQISPIGRKNVFIVKEPDSSGGAANDAPIRSQHGKVSCQNW